MLDQSIGDVSTSPFQPNLPVNRINQTIAGRFVLLKKLKSGGMGDVYRAWESELEREVVLKFVSPDLAAQPQRAAQLLNEAKRAASLNHPHVVTVYHSGQEDRDVFIVFELVTGEDAAEILQRTRQPLAVDRAVRLILQVGSALQRAHDLGIVHRDVKPSNILIGPNDVATLADFGLATGERESKGSGVGTPGYMALELCEADGHATPASDQYSLAMTLAHLVTGLKPDHPDNLDTARIPGNIRPIVMRGLARRPADRFDSVAEFCDALDAALKPTAPTAESRHRPHAPSSSWLPVLLALCAVCVVVVIALQIQGAFRDQWKANNDAHTQTGDQPTSESPVAPTFESAVAPTSESSVAPTQSGSSQPQGPGVPSAKPKPVAKPDISKPATRPKPAVPEVPPPKVPEPNTPVVELDPVTAKIKNLTEAATTKFSKSPNKPTDVEVAAIRKDVEKNELEAITSAIDRDRTGREPKALVAGWYEYRARVYRLLGQATNAQRDTEIAHDLKAASDLPD